MKKLTSLEVKPIPEPFTGHPLPGSEIIPRHEFTLGLIAPKGSGKTSLICNLLRFYKGYFHNILIFSPTVSADEKWDWVKQQDLLIENLEMKKWLKEFSKTRKEDTLVQRGAPSMELEGLVNQKEKWSPKIPEECFYETYEEDKLMEIMEEQMGIIKLLKKFGQPKSLANRILIIFDDLVGSGLFGGSRGNYFKGLNTRHRHYSASFIMVSQGYKEIPKTIRTNWSSLIIFEIGNEKELEVIYEEYAMSLNLKDWMEAYRYATEGDYNFLYLNYQAKKNMRMMKNFQEYLFTK